jgi:hypothetical protein
MTFHANGLGKPLCTDWLSMDTPVGEFMREAGPDGWMEFSEVQEGVQMWRMWKPFDWAVGG